MSTEQEARRTPHDPSGQEEPEGPNYIARSVAAKTAWLQRVLSPWARRWLEGGVEATAPAEQHSQTALTVGNTQRLMGRVQRLVERGTVWRPEAVSLQPAMVDGFAGSIVNRFPDTGSKYELRRSEAGPAQAADLVLAGAGEPAPASAQPGGQSFQPFTSLAEFRKAIEAKQHAPQAGPAAVEPPQAGQPAQPQVQRSPVQQAPTPVQRAPAEPPKARRVARTLPPGSRPVSRVEEVLPGAETAPKAETTLQTQAERQAPDVQRRAVETVPTPLEEEAPPPAEASPPAPVAGRTASPAGPQTPAVQRQPEPGPAAPLEEGAGADEVKPPRPPAGREVTPPAVQRQAAGTAPAPAQPPAPARPPQAEEALPAAGLPPAGLEMPVVQRRPEAEPGPSPAPAGESLTAEAGPPGPPPAPDMRPIQRQAAEEAPARASTAAEAGPPAPPAVRRRAVEEAPAPPPATGYAEPGPPSPPAELDMPLAQRHAQAAEGTPGPARPPREPEAPPPVVEAGLPEISPAISNVQRRVAGEAPAQPPTQAGQEPPAPPPAVQRQAVETPPSQKEVAPPGGPELDNEMPLVQRQEAEQKAESESPAAPVIEAAAPGRPERPPLQRQTAVTTPPPAQQPEEEAAPPAPPVVEHVEKPAPAGPEMPLAQRQAAETAPISAQPPRQRPAETLPAAHDHDYEHENKMPLVQRQEVEVEPPVAPAAGEAAPPRQGPGMPSVQRQPAETGGAPAPSSHAEGAPPELPESPDIEAKLPGPPAGGETPPARPGLPLVQRSPRAEGSPVEAGPDQMHEPAAGLEGEVVARAASRARLPLIEPPSPAPVEAIRTKPVEQTAILPQVRVQAQPEGGAEPPALTHSRPGAQTGWVQAAAAGELPLPPPLQRSVAPARPASTAWIQRQPETPGPVVTPRPEPWHEGTVQRVVEGQGTPSLPTGVGESSPPQPTEEKSTSTADLDSLARQIYPLIKRMLAVERERKWGR